MNQLDLKGRVAVVTGGARGIGFAIAQRILGSGGSVAIWDRDVSRMREAQQALGERCSTHEVNLTELGAVEASAQATLARHGKVDILVNNAGVTGGNALAWELDPVGWKEVVDINLIAPYYTCRSLIPHMIGQGYGRIVNIASIAGKEGNPNASHYSASKAGLIGLTKSLGKELAGKGVLVNAVTPAVAKTDMFASMTQQHIDYMLSKIPMARFVGVDEIAAMVCWLSSEDCSFSTGAVFDISGGRGTY
ncbi:SDR family NAD(P)-dependent oxidoreductase [Paracandidimonas lactea]|uniref:SDR family NAD(P)-dependent oxidoreductase n=1 Tax=Paracandidimonas lactea TaxID=2895524 RepID=UPI001F44AF40|nr:SDR family NAD(P)-dependent oxidoreductase [Paracandidimonas lactea]